MCFYLALSIYLVGLLGVTHSGTKVLFLILCSGVTPNRIWVVPGIEPRLAKFKTSTLSGHFFSIVDSLFDCFSLVTCILNYVFIRDCQLQGKARGNTFLKEADLVSVSKSHENWTAQMKVTFLPEMKILKLIKC